MTCTGGCRRAIERNESSYEVYATKNWGGASGPSRVYCVSCWETLVGEEGRK